MLINKEAFVLECYKRIEFNIFLLEKFKIYRLSYFQIEFDLKIDHLILNWQQEKNKEY